MLMFVSDNASNNDTLATCLDNKMKAQHLLTEYPHVFRGCRHRVQCFAHILNLVMQVIGLKSYCYYPTQHTSPRHSCECLSERCKEKTVPEVMMSGPNLLNKSTSIPSRPAVIAVTILTSMMPVTWSKT